jgi:hypothetical protein
MKITDDLRRIRDDATTEQVCCYDTRMRLQTTRLPTAPSSRRCARSVGCAFRTCRYTRHAAFKFRVDSATEVSFCLCCNFPIICDLRPASNDWVTTLASDTATLAHRQARGCPQSPRRRRHARASCCANPGRHPPQVALSPPRHSLRPSQSSARCCHRNCAR